MSEAKLRAGSTLPGWRIDEILISALQHIAGTGLVLAAWVLVTSDRDHAAYSALLTGFAILGLTAANQVRFLPVLERATALIGLSAFSAPWLLSFARNDLATWAHVLFGGVTVVAAIYWLEIARKP